MTPWRRTLNNEDVCFVDEFVWTIYLGVYSVGVYSLGVYNSRATDFGSGAAPTWEATVWESTVWESTVWESTVRAMEFGSGGPHTHSFENL